ncbi:MAG: hypothetical protein KBF83_07180 [Pyrinomonadaceae bacterium]|nr:hypothetical protein [Pyrinomonadaceae bacterium]MBP9109323.1 hypothetical protein [Pyrinomonadaceae bacterium]
MTSFKFREISGRHSIIKVVALVAIVFAYFGYVNDIDTNPPGFYLDEAAVSYNAWHIYTEGSGDAGVYLPLYFPMFPLGPPFDYLGYVDPVQIYLLAFLNFFFDPSVAVSRGLSATMMFLASILLGSLARNISGRSSIGLLVALIALMTPWLFEIGRLAFGAPLYPFMLALLLIAVFRVAEKERWSLLDSGLIGSALALCTYTYAIGRLFGPILALGLLMFAFTLRRFKGVAVTWVFYGISLIPLLVFHINTPGALAGRLNITVGYMSPDKGYGQIFSEFIGHYIANVNVYQMLFTGDLNYRHHVPGTAAILVVPLLLSLVGIVVVLVRHLKSGWWRYMIFGLIASPIPASMTRDDFHALRLCPLPVFLIMFMVPTLMLLLGSKREDQDSEQEPQHKGRRWRSALAGLLLTFTVAQAVSFYLSFQSFGNGRDGYFDHNFGKVFAAAIAQPERPIYLTDQYYYQALWQAAVQGIDESNFFQLPPRSRPPADAIVLSGEEKCSECTMLVKDIPFVLYKTHPAPQSSRSESPPGPNMSVPGALPLATPRGLAPDGKGGYVVADTGNSLIQRFDATGKFVVAFGTAGDGNGEFREPQGIAVDAKGDIWVTDAFLHKLMKFKPDGTFVKEWAGPDTGFYGPRDCEFGPGGELYIVDQGRNRISVFNPATENFRTFGSTGSGEGQLNDPIGISIGGGNVFVADAGNRRVQVFDPSGRFIRQWMIPGWASEVQYVRDIVFDSAVNKVYVTSTKSDQIVAFDLNGNPVDGPILPITEGIATPGVLTFIESGTRRELLILYTVKSRVIKIEMEQSRDSKPIRKG